MSANDGELRLNASTACLFLFFVFKFGFDLISCRRDERNVLKKGFESWSKTKAKRAVKLECTLLVHRRRSLERASSKEILYRSLSPGKAKVVGRVHFHGFG